jgi:hypothetical protein
MWSSPMELFRGILLAAPMSIVAWVAAIYIFVP